MNFNENIEHNMQKTIPGIYHVLIVESRNKAKTIAGYVDQNIRVLHTEGHIAELEGTYSGIHDQKQKIYDFEPKTYLNQNGLRLLRELRLINFDTVYLATDADREGEVISYDIQQLILSQFTHSFTYHRVLFHEINKKTINESIKNVQRIDLDLVESQITRRLLDRIVGFNLSPKTWMYLGPGLSVGRVQTVALSMFVERFEQIKNFVPTHFIRLVCSNSQLNVKSNMLFRGKQQIDIELSNELNLALNLNIDFSQHNLDQQYTLNCTFKLLCCNITDVKLDSIQPFKTTTLQRLANSMLGFSAKKTMSVAQSLFEGKEIELNGEKSTIGLITYPRTDSCRVSDEALTSMECFIQQKFGPGMFVSPQKIDKKQLFKQDAHECIRPTNINMSPNEIKSSLTRDEFHLYELIFNFFHASCMKPPTIQRKTCKYGFNELEFSVSESKITSLGYYQIEYMFKGKSNEYVHTFMPDMNTMSDLTLRVFMSQTKPPAKYNESSIIQTLESYGIGRPSTYATIVPKLLEKKFLDEELNPTDLGAVLSYEMKHFFAQIFEVDFTSKMENILELIRQGTQKRIDSLRNWCDIICDNMMLYTDHIKVLKSGLTTKLPCFTCGECITIRFGRFGVYSECSRKHTVSMLFRNMTTILNSLYQKKDPMTIRNIECFSSSMDEPKMILTNLIDTQKHDVYFVPSKSVLKCISGCEEMIQFSVDQIDFSRRVCLLVENTK